MATGRLDVSILVTGIGRKNAERIVREALARATPSLVLTCGFAGGLDPSLAIGTVLFATHNIGLREKLSAAGANPGRFLCATRIATTAKEKQELHRTTAADAVEMESEAIHLVCQERGIPCATVRVISDHASEDLPLDFNQLASEDMKLHHGKLALAVAKSPAKIGALLRLQRQARHAAEKLAELLIKFLSRQQAIGWKETPRAS